MTNKFDIDIFQNNLELLRPLTGKNKGNFAKLIGIANAYRKDFDTLGPKMIKGITDNFQGVDENWLLSRHPEGTAGIKFTSCENTKTVLYPVPADLQADVDAITGEVTYIMRSGKTDIIEALKKNVKEFRRAVDTDNELKDCRVLMVGMQKQIDELTGKVDRLTAPPTSVEGSGASWGKEET